MIEIASIAQSLVDRIKTVPAYEGKVGFMIGGNPANDRFTRDLPPPSVFVVFVGENLEEEAGLYSCRQKVRLNFDVRIVVGVDSESDLINVQLPLLHETVEAVLGQEPVPGGHWSYDGSQLVAMDSRWVWNQRYSITTMLGN